MNLWHIILLLGDLVLLQLVIGIIMERRNPTATWVWLLVLVFAPLIGIPLYLIFGRVNVRRRVRRFGTSARNLRAALRDWETFAERSELLCDLPPEHLLMARLVKGLGGSELRGSNRVAIFQEGGAIFEALAAAIEGAQRYVHLLYYIFDEGEVGRRIRAALEEAAGRGVEVRVILDAFGSGRLPEEFFRRLEELGGRVVRFAPLHFNRMRRRPDFRNHRKILVADGTVGFVGGFNITDRYIRTDEPSMPWRDTHLRIEGGAVHDLERLLMESWSIATGEMLASEEHLPSPGGPDGHGGPGGTTLQTLGGGPDDSWSNLEMAVVAAIQLASRCIDITTPYFIPSETVASALMSAALRGVEVRLMVPADNDQRLVAWASRSYYQELIEAGVRIFEYGPRMHHAKTLSVDGRIGIVGSANLDLRSFRLNYEVGTVLYDPELGAQLDRQFELDLLGSREVTPEAVQSWSRLQRLRNNTFRLLSPLL